MARTKRQSVVERAPRPCYYRSPADWIAHLAVLMSELSEHQIRAARDATCGDLMRAKPEEIEAAKRLLGNAGVRLVDDSPPAWHFAKAAFTRGAYD
jgi:hypothetical protein